MVKRRKAVQPEVQLSLFPEEQKPVEVKEPTVLEFVRARFEYGPDMTPEEYRHWIKVLVHSSIKKMS